MQRIGVNYDASCESSQITILVVTRANGTNHFVQTLMPMLMWPQQRSSAVCSVLLDFFYVV
jgi:hypothetical protein